jgi:hypothetical protein
MNSRFLLLVFAGLLALGQSGLKAQDEPFAVKKNGDNYRVEIDGKLFTEYIPKGYNKPVLYPIIGPHGVSMTRHYPFKEVEGEARDHVHHASLWFTHGEVNGISFWHNGKNTGKIIPADLVRATGGSRGSIVSNNNWVGPDGKVICTDRTSISFHKAFDGIFVSYSVTLFASEGDVTFGDTKEGTMGIRTHPNLRLTNGRGVTTANGKAVNSAGQRDKELWGKRAKWVDYSGKIDGHTVGVAIFDHPDNLRHPTWWHARDYGLVAANPFGIHNFEGKKKGVGDFKLKKGERRNFLYGILFHEGDAETSDIAGSYDKWVQAVAALKASAAEQSGNP